MKFNKLMKSFGFVLVASLFIVSCSDENSVILEEQEEVLENGIEFVVDGRSIVFDAEAIYCNANGKELLSVSNSPDLLGNIEFELEDIEVDDYLLNMVVDPNGNGTFDIGGVVFGESLTGNPDLTQASFIVGIDIDITSNDGTSVIGSFSGDFLVLSATGEITEIPYTVNFNAEIIGTADFCD